MTTLLQHLILKDFIFISKTGASDKKFRRRSEAKTLVQAKKNGNQGKKVNVWRPQETTTEDNEEMVGPGSAVGAAIALQPQKHQPNQFFKLQSTRCIPNPASPLKSMGVHTYLEGRRKTTSSAKVA